MRSIRTREAAEGINQPPASLEEIEGLSASYSILASSALNPNVDPVWDETAEHQTDLGTFEVLSVRFSLFTAHVSGRPLVPASRLTAHH